MRLLPSRVVSRPAPRPAPRPCAPPLRFLCITVLLAALELDLQTKLAQNFAWN